MDLNTLGDLKDQLNLSGMGKPAFVGIVAVLLAVAVVAGWNLVGTATAHEFEVSKAPSQESSSEASEKAAAATIFIHVSGAVVNPGLYEVSGGSRVADAVNAAGGFNENAAIDSINLARCLVDGEQVIVGRQSDQSAEGAVASAAGNTATVAGGLVNINTASAAELVSLPGIGEATAVKIVSDRQANGPFKTIDDLKRVSGIGDKKFEALSELICV